MSVQSQQFKGQQQQQDSSTSFRLIDESSRIAAAAADAMQLCTPPKQSKPSSIFSPDWKETTAAAAGGEQMGGKSRSSHAPPGMVGLGKPIKDSPSSREKKPILPGYPEQQQQKQRSDTPKKDRRSAVDAMAQKQKSSSSSSSLKRSLESMSAPSLSMPGGSGSTVDPTDLLGLSKHPSAPSAVKRSLTGSEQVRQEDGTDFRESKVRKVEPTSPSEALFSSSFDLSNTFDKEASDGFSMFSFGDPGSLLSQPLLSDSKPPPGLSSNSNSKSGFPSTINGIETNPALVSSLLKESLQQDSKFGILSSSVTQSASEPPPMVSLPDTVNIKTEAPDMNAPATISSLLAPTTLSTAVPTSLTATNSDVLQTLTGDPVTAIAAAAAKDSEDPHRIKTEKKKKKDKHKHKEKDKSKDKDREERKKHKKDKDRHRDKSDQGTASDASLVSPPAAPPGPIKIKLPKDKLNLPSLSGTADPEPGLKIKIPKDRLSGSASSLNPPPSNTQQQPVAAVPLKLKISKDKIEHYNISSDGPTTAAGGYNNGSGAAASSSAAAGPSGSSHGGSHSHSSSSKKKDRDKDREKSKSSKSGSSGSSGDYSKQNGGGGGGATGSSNKSSSSSSKQSVPSTQLPAPMAGSQASASSISHHPASFDYMQHAQAPSLLQQQQYFNQFGGAFNVQQQHQQMQQMLMNNSAIKMPGTTPSFYYGTSNQSSGGGGGNSGKK